MDFTHHHAGDVSIQVRELEHMSHSLTVTFPGYKLWPSHWSEGLFLSPFCSAYYSSCSLSCMLHYTKTCSAKSSRAFFNPLPFWLFAFHSFCQPSSPSPFQKYTFKYPAHCFLQHLLMFLLLVPIFETPHFFSLIFCLLLSNFAASLFVSIVCYIYASFKRVTYKEINIRISLSSFDQEDTAEVQTFRDKMPVQYFCNIRMIVYCLLKTRFL